MPHLRAKGMCQAAMLSAVLSAVWRVRQTTVLRRFCPAGVLWRILQAAELAMEASQAPREPQARVSEGQPATFARTAASRRLRCDGMQEIFAE